MAKRDILEYPHPRLREAASPVATFDADLGSLIDDMIETLDDTDSIALSAPQVDDGRAVLIIRPSDDAGAPRTYVNPEIAAKRGMGIVQESCLSLPGVVGSVMRALEVDVRAHDRDGNLFETTLTGMDAVSLQHEIDHLNGKLFVDRLFLLQRLRFHAFAGKRARRRAMAA